MVIGRAIAIWNTFHFILVLHRAGFRKTLGVIIRKYQSDRVLRSLIVWYRCSLKYLLYYRSRFNLNCQLLYTSNRIQSRHFQFECNFHLYSISLPSLLNRIFTTILDWFRSIPAVMSTLYSLHLVGVTSLPPRVKN